MKIKAKHFRIYEKQINAGRKKYYFVLQRKLFFWWVMSDYTCLTDLTMPWIYQNRKFESIEDAQRAIDSIVKYPTVRRVA